MFYHSFTAQLTLAEADLEHNEWTVSRSRCEPGTGCYQWPVTHLRHESQHWWHRPDMGSGDCVTAQKSHETQCQAKSGVQGHEHWRRSEAVQRVLICNLWGGRYLIRIGTDFYGIQMAWQQSKVYLETWHYVSCCWRVLRRMLRRVFWGSGKLSCSLCHAVTWIAWLGAHVTPVTGPGRHFPCLSPSVAGCNWFIPRFIVIRDSEPGLIDIKIIKARDTPSEMLYSGITVQNNTKWNFENLIQDFMIIIISKMPFCVKARAAGSRSPLPIMMIWNQFRRGTGYLTEFRVILYNRNKYKCAQKGLFSCCASAVHLKSLHLMTDDFGMMTYWKVMKVMMHILRMSKQ